MKATLYQVDAFTAEPFRGNPAAVLFLDGPREETFLAAFAAEMNLSETAFVWPEGDALRLRWFTPALEVDLCGHATLATAHVLWESGRLAHAEPAHFLSRSGPLVARRRGEEIELDFPALPVTSAPIPDELAAILGTDALEFGQSRDDALARVADAATVRALAPDLAALARWERRGLIVTAEGDDGKHDIVSRFFGPAVGIDEDPVTGSAHCVLAPFWAERLGKMELRAHQASPRGGWLGVRLEGERVVLSGSAVTIFAGRPGRALDPR